MQFKQNIFYFYIGLFLSIEYIAAANNSEKATDSLMNELRVIFNRISTYKVNNSDDEDVYKLTQQVDSTEENKETSKETYYDEIADNGSDQGILVVPPQVLPAQEIPTTDMSPQQPPQSNESGPTLVIVCIVIVTVSVLVVLIWYMLKHNGQRCLDMDNLSDTDSAQELIVLDSDVIAYQFQYWW